MRHPGIQHDYRTQEAAKIIGQLTREMVDNSRTIRELEQQLLLARAQRENIEKRREPVMRVWSKLVYAVALSQYGLPTVYEGAPNQGVTITSQEWLEVMGVDVERT